MPNTNPWKLITQVLNAQGTETGKVVGQRSCRMEGCRDYCLGVRWPDKKLTWPCVGGMKIVNETTAQIQ